MFGSCWVFLLGGHSQTPKPEEEEEEEDKKEEDEEEDEEDEDEEDVCTLAKSLLFFPASAGIPAPVLTLLPIP